MCSDQPQQMIVSLPLHKLHPHPDNTNRMSNVKFNTLIKHIEATRQYEPLAVRKHPTKVNAWQILNGHHRLRALRKLKHTHADCVVFKANDEQAHLYLLNLNRLTGRDNVYKKARLIDQICENVAARDLAKQIPDSKTAIEKLVRLSQDQPLPKTTESKPFLLPMTFFMTESQYAIITDAINKAGNNSSGGRSQKRLDALCEIAKAFLKMQSKSL